MKRAAKKPASPEPTVCGISDQESEQRLDEIVARAMLAWRPPPKLSLSEWADRYYRLSAESAAEPGPWKTLPYQRGIMDAVTDPRVERISVMKSARVGFTLSMSAAIGYFMHQDPAAVMVVQPTVEAAQVFSKETVSAMLRDVPVLSKIAVRDQSEGPKNSANTILHKAFPGGSLSFVGANSGAGFRAVSRRIVIFDEVDCYPPSAGSEGDPISLGEKRTEAFWNRKLIAGSTPLIAGASRIEKRFSEGDQRRYYVPCPHCGAMDFLAFREGDRGHWMAWPEGKPREAHFVCRGCGCEIEHKHKRAMVEGGEWRADAEFRGHASFHLWAAYSYSPNATWGHIAEEFTVANKAGPLQLQTFVNTTLGETWTEKGEAPEYARLYQRREHYARGTVPEGVVLLTAGVDVMRDRLVYEVVGWLEDRQSFSVEAAVIAGDTAGEDVWTRLETDVLNYVWTTAQGGTMPLRMLGVDSGDQTQTVYGWARRHLGRVIATKGVPGSKPILGAPSSVDVTTRGRKYSRGAKVWPVGVDAAKKELYGWLRLDPPTVESGDPHPPGFCHFPEYGEDFFRQLTAEHLVATRHKGFVIYEFHVIPGRENHYLDARVLARAAAVQAGLDRLAARKRVAAPRPSAQPARPAAVEAASGVPPVAPPVSLPPAAPRERPSRGGFLGGSGGRRGGWLGR